MKRLATLALLAAASFSSTLYALDNEGLKKLHKAGLDDETILLKMEQEPAEYDLSIDGLIDLKDAGLSEEIIQAALGLSSGRDAPRSGDDSERSSGREKGFAKQDFPSVMKAEADPEMGEIYFTRISFFQEGGKHVATNYSRSRIVPINTEVEYLGQFKKGFQIRILDTGEVIKMVNVPDYTGESDESLASRYLAASRTPLEKLPEDMVTSIETGQLRLGMTKEQALMARGYPPIHETPNTKLDRWVYWTSRFVKLTIVFRDDRLVEGRGLY